MNMCSIIKTYLSKTSGSRSISKCPQNWRISGLEGHLSTFPNKTKDILHIYVLQPCVNGLLWPGSLRTNNMISDLINNTITVSPWKHPALTSLLSIPSVQHMNQDFPSTLSSLCLSTWLPDRDFQQTAASLQRRSCGLVPSRPTALNPRLRGHHQSHVTESWSTQVSVVT